MDLKVQALKAKYQAEKLAAIATLEVYVKNSVGIGEHPQVIEEMANSNDCLEALEEIFVQVENDRTDVAQEGSVNS